MSTESTKLPHTRQSSRVANESEDLSQNQIVTDTTLHHVNDKDITAPSLFTTDGSRLAISRPTALEELEILTKVLTNKEDNEIMGGNPQDVNFSQLAETRSSHARLPILSSSKGCSNQSKSWKSTIYGVFPATLLF